MNRMVLRVVLLMAAVFSLFVLAGCGNDDTPDIKDQLVKTQRAVLGDEAAEGTYSGVVRGRYETNMAFQISGRIMSRNVQLGDRVNAGDVIMVMDARDVAQQSNQGDAQVAAARAQLNLAEANLGRYRALYEQDAIPASVLDQYQTAYDAALASYENALAAAEQGHNALGYSNLVAGASGVISSISAEAGQVVAAGQTVATLTQTDELEVEVSIPENHLEDAVAGKAVSVSFWALGKDIVTGGVIREVSPVADAVARTYKIRVSVPNPPNGLKLGMTASVVIPQSSGDDASSAAGAALAVLPLSAIYQTEDTPKVWVVDKDSMTVSLKDVTVVSTGDNKVSVKGLSSDDIVVVAGVHKLREGTRVRLSEGDN